MMTEKEIVGKVKRLKYASQRAGAGFHLLINNPLAKGNPLTMLHFREKANFLEVVLGYTVEVKNVNWFNAAYKVRTRKGKKLMNIKIMTTEKKLTKSMINQMKEATSDSIFQGTAIGYLMNVKKTISKLILIEYNGEYFVVSAA